MVTFEQMTTQERAACVELAARAFADYEYFSVYVPDDKRRLRFLKAMLTAEFKVNADRAAFFTIKNENKLRAVVMLCDPNYQKPTDMEYMKAGFGKVFLRGGIRNVSAWNAMEAEAMKPYRSFTGNVWYLNLLTVDPAYEGKGFGSEIMQDHILPYVRDHGGDSLCLFTNSEINRRFYRKNGFEEFHEQQFTYKGKTIGSWSYQIKIE